MIRKRYEPRPDPQPQQRQFMDPTEQAGWDRWLHSHLADVVGGVAEGAGQLHRELAAKIKDVSAEAATLRVEVDALKVEVADVRAQVSKARTGWTGNNTPLKLLTSRR